MSKSTPFSEGTVIMAEDQYAGKGQAGNQWISDPGKNLTFSILLEPIFLKPCDQFDLNIVICVSIFKTLSPLLGDQLKIKWPNDIYVGNRKLGGILIENALQGNKLRHSIVGIGLNVNQEDFGDIDNACSIKHFLHREYTITNLLYELWRSIEENYFLLMNEGVLFLKSLYIKNLYRLNKVSKYKVDGVLVDGKIVDVDLDGQLVVDFNGHNARFNFREIEFVF